MTAGLRLSLLPRPDGARDVFTVHSRPAHFTRPMLSRDIDARHLVLVQPGLLLPLERVRLSLSPLALKTASHTM